MRQSLLIGLLCMGLVQLSHANSFFKNHTFVFFFSSKCPYCQQFAPVLKQWGVSHGASILPLSFDNQPLAGFYDFIPVSTQWVNEAYEGKSITYPALFIANKEDHLLYPVVFGAMTNEELDVRLGQIMSKIKNYEAGRSSI